MVAGQLAESLDDPRSVVVVEWAKAVGHVLPDKRIIIEFEPVKTSADERQITIHYPGSFAPTIEKTRNDWSLS